MTSPPSSSSESSSQAPYTSSSLSSFDPFAVHPFTNCSVNQNNTPVQPSIHHGYAYPYGPSMASYTTAYNQFPQTPTANGLPSSSAPQSSPKPYGYSSHNSGVFIPFRKETASPELGDVLKANKTKASNSLSSSNLPQPPSQPAPITNTRKY
ncbi:hypothetical protein NLJ89_g1558 [Agrocybe chaxingu]|uniref:Uncharacterized protein n=1 Tax=Agrocybe chaxingu TaxID=84603 RepID=A0A9W8MZS2_9AGAR|nr:hypothetical protein NLJ89_g1558 [Agrocybe chaxingu]